jgi:hypothetical protein
MALTDLQKKILRLLAGNRSEKSYLAGGLLLNRDWSRGSNDIHIFHDSDEEVAASAKKDMDVLSAAGFRAQTDVLTYGCVDATVSEGASATVIQWSGETKSRFFPLVKDEDWGARLHQADLAVNKVLAAIARSKARDIADLIAIAIHYCPLGPLVIAAAGKPPNFSPKRTIDEIRRHALSIPAEEYLAVKGLPADWSAEFIREEALRLTERADTYVMSAPIEIVGLLAVDPSGVPIEVTNESLGKAILRKATDEPEVMPSPAEFDVSGWSGTRP